MTEAKFLSELKVDSLSDALALFLGLLAREKYTERLEDEVARLKDQIRVQECWSEGRATIGMSKD